MIEDVEDFSSQLYAQVLRDVSVFEDREVDVVITRTAQSVAAKRAEVPRAGNARPGTPITGGIKRAGHLESREVDESIRLARARVRIADQIGSREKLARVVVIVKQRQVKRIAAAHRHDCV